MQTELNEYNFWIINYISCESNKRWYLVRCPSTWSEYDVETKANSLCGGCGDDMAEIINVERTTMYNEKDVYTDWQ